MAETAAAPDDARERLRQHFLHDRTPNRWDELWKDGSFLPWDRGVPNPALEDTLATKGDIIGSPLRKDGSSKRALVPGCGKGYDVHMLAAFGYDAFGLEVGNAVEAARKFVGEVGGREEYVARDAKVGKGKVEFVEGDFYKRGWEKNLVGEQGGFDIIYDYTVRLLRLDT
jgi:SAM-dependent methyltransferase